MRPLNPEYPRTKVEANFRDKLPRIENTTYEEELARYEAHCLLRPSYGKKPPAFNTYAWKQWAEAHRTWCAENEILQARLAAFGLESTKAGRRNWTLASGPC